MSSDWKEISLLDVFDVRNGLTKKREEFGFGEPFIAFKDVFNNYFIPSKLESLANTTAKEQRKYSIKKGDVLITRTSENFEELGMTSVALKNYPGATYNGFTKRLRPKKEFELNPEYLGFFFRSPFFRRQILSLTTMTTRASLNNEMLARLKIRLPSTKEQNEIAEILGSCHEKIHLNQQTNETLEALAQAIFKSWFVDFDPVRAKIEAISAGRDPNRAAMAAISGVSWEDEDWDAIDSALQQKLDRMSADQLTQLRQTAELFPDELVESEIGMVPKGWEYSTIDKEFDIVNGQSPPGSTYNEEGEGAPFYQGRTDFGFRFPTQRVYCTEPKRFAKKGDTLLSVRAPVGDLNIAIEDCCIGRGLASLRHKSGSVSYTYYAMKQVQSQIEAYEATGTVFGSINQKQLKALDTIAPDKRVINEFHRIADPIDSKIMNQVFMNRELSELRDTLLPKLISGKLELI